MCPPFCGVSVKSEDSYIIVRKFTGILILRFHKTGEISDLTSGMHYLLHPPHFHIVNLKVIATNILFFLVPSPHMLLFDLRGSDF